MTYYVSAFNGAWFLFVVNAFGLAEELMIYQEIAKEIPAKPSCPKSQRTLSNGIHF